MNARETRRAARRRALLDAAMRIVNEGGPEALTIAGLAEALGASVGGLYRYFPGKEAILVALQADALVAYHADLHADMRAAEARIRSASKADPAGPVAALCRVLVAFGAYLRDAARAPERHRLMDALVSAPRPLLDDAEAREVNASLQPILETCGALLEAAESAGALRPGDAAQRTHLVWAAMHGLDHFRKRDRIQPPALRVATLATELMRSFLAGWGASPSAIGAALVLTDGVDGVP